MLVFWAAHRIHFIVHIIFCLLWASCAPSSYSQQLRHRHRFKTCRRTATPRSRNILEANQEQRSGIKSGGRRRTLRPHEFPRRIRTVTSITVNGGLSSPLSGTVDQKDSAEKTRKYARYPTPSNGGNWWQGALESGVAIWNQATRKTSLRPLLAHGGVREVQHQAR